MMEDSELSDLYDNSVKIDFTNDYTTQYEVIDNPLHEDIKEFVPDSDLDLMVSGNDVPLPVFCEDEEPTIESSDPNEILVQIMDIRTPLDKLRAMLEQRLCTDLTDYTFWLQNAKMLESHKTLVDQCIRGEGDVQVNIKVRTAGQKIDIVDVLKPDEEVVQLTDDDVSEIDSHGDDVHIDDSLSQGSDHSQESEVVHAPSYKWIVDVQFKEQQERLKIPSDPVDWLVQHVRLWIQWAVRHFGLTNIKLQDWTITGQELVELTHSEFKEKVVSDPGDIFWTHLELLRKCKIVAVVQSEESPKRITAIKSSATIRNKSTKVAVCLTNEEISNLSPSSDSMGQVHLWQFLLDLLTNAEYTNVICWQGNEGEFKLLEPETVARLWGIKKNKPAMNYEKLSRALRYYYDGDMISKVHGKRFVYKFVCDLEQLIGLRPSELSELVDDVTSKEDVQISETLTPTPCMTLTPCKTIPCQLDKGTIQHIADIPEVEIVEDVEMSMPLTPCKTPTPCMTLTPCKTIPCQLDKATIQHIADIPEVEIVEDVEMSMPLTPCKTPTPCMTLTPCKTIPCQLDKATIQHIADIPEVEIVEDVEMSMPLTPCKTPTPCMTLTPCKTIPCQLDKATIQHIADIPANKGEKDLQNSQTPSKTIACELKKDTNQHVNVHITPEDETKEDVQISVTLPCMTNPRELKKETNQHINFHITPDVKGKEDVQNSVTQTPYLVPYTTIPCKTIPRELKKVPNQHITVHIPPESQEANVDVNDGSHGSDHGQRFTVPAASYNWIVDKKFEKDQVRNNIPSDPEMWQVRHVQYWIQWATYEFRLRNINLDQWAITGKDLMKLTNSDIKQRVGSDPAGVFWIHFELLRICKCVAIIKLWQKPRIRKPAIKKKMQLNNQKPLIDRGEVKAPVPINLEKEIFIMSMGLQTPMIEIKTALSKELTIDLSGYTLWLHNSKNCTKLEFYKTLAGECMLRDGEAQVYVIVKTKEQRLEILDAVVPDPEIAQYDESKIATFRFEAAPYALTRSETYAELMRRYAKATGISNEIVPTTPSSRGFMKRVHLWRFLLDLLSNPHYNTIIRWQGCKGAFKMLEPEKVAQLWGIKRHNPTMNYVKLSRAIRYYYNTNKIRKVKGKSHVYQFLDDFGEDARPSELSKRLQQTYASLQEQP